MGELKTGIEIRKHTLNLVGMSFGALTVTSLARYYKHNTYWMCTCSCGNTIEVNQKDLFSSVIRSCGCKDATITNYPSISRQAVKGVYWEKGISSWKVAITYQKIKYSIGCYKNFDDAINARKQAEAIISELKKGKEVQGKQTKPVRDLTGERFGSLTVLSLKETGKYTIWHCKCDCGTEKDFYQHNLTSGKSTSCGCVQRKIAKKTREQNIHIYKGIQIEKAKAKTTPKNNTTGFRGVVLDKRTGKYRVRMILQGVRYELGWYTDLQEAIQARLVAEEKRDAIVEEYIELKSLQEGENK